MGKKERTHQFLLETATSLFVEKRSGNVSMDEIAESAGVARRTLFNHFENKEQLVLEIVEPIFMDGINFVRQSLEKQSIFLEDIINLCQFLWDNHGSCLQLLFSIDFEDFNSLKSLHGQYLGLYMEFCNRIADLPDELKQSKHVVASLIFRCFLPIITKTETMTNSRERFAGSIRGMITGMVSTG